MTRNTYLLSLFLLVGLLVGCGGGTRGTGLGSGGEDITLTENEVFSLEGKVTRDGEVLSGVTITVLNTGDQTETGPFGGFDLQVDPPEGITLDLEFDAGTELYRGSIDAFGDRYDLRVDLDAKEMVVTRVSDGERTIRELQQVEVK